MPFSACIAVTASPCIAVTASLILLLGLSTLHTQLILQNISVCPAQLYSQVGMCVLVRRRIILIFRNLLLMKGVQLVLY